ncbi:MAG TPA: hypothetical protein VF020_05460 [Chthoniobacterales bacterium]
MNLPRPSLNPYRLTSRRLRCFYSGYSQLIRLEVQIGRVENTYEYENEDEVIDAIKENVIGPAEATVKELRSGSIA